MQLSLQSMWQHLSCIFYIMLHTVAQLSYWLAWSASWRANHQQPCWLVKFQMIQDDSSCISPWSVLHSYICCPTCHYLYPYSTTTTTTMKTKKRKSSALSNKHPDLTEKCWWLRQHIRGWPFCLNHPNSKSLCTLLCSSRCHLWWASVQHCHNQW